MGWPAASVQPLLPSYSDPVSAGQHGARVGHWDMEGDQCPVQCQSYRAGFTFTEIQLLTVTSASNARDLAIGDFRPLRLLKVSQ